MSLTTAPVKRKRANQEHRSTNSTRPAKSQRRMSAGSNSESALQRSLSSRWIELLTDTFGWVSEAVARAWKASSTFPGSCLRYSQKEEPLTRLDLLKTQNRWRRGGSPNTESASKWVCKNTKIFGTKAGNVRWGKLYFVAYFAASASENKQPHSDKSSRIVLVLNSSVLPCVIFPDLHFNAFSAFAKDSGVI